MTIKIKNLTVKMSILIVVFLFACNSGNSNPSLSEKQLLELVRGKSQNHTVNQADQTLSLSATDTVSKSTDAKPRNTEWADADGNPIYKHYDVYGNQLTENYFRIQEKPLYNGNEFLKEWEKYINENNKFAEIYKENNIQWGTKISISFEIIINPDGSIDAKLNDFSDKHQAFVDDYLRVLNEFRELGVVVPGKHNGKVLKARIPANSYTIVITYKEN